MIENRQTQLTFEEIGILNEEDLDLWCNEFGGGYGGWDANEVFSRLLPRGYSLLFIKELMSNRYLCMIREEKDFEADFEKYKKNPILEYEEEYCKSCGRHKRTIIKWYERTGKYLNKKGKLIKEC